MSPVVIDVRSEEDVHDVVHRAVRSLVEGELVVLPTETVYGVAALALNGDAVARAPRGQGPQGHPMSLAIRGPDEARDYAPDMSALAKRLARRCWPGPVTLVVNDAHPESLVRQLPTGRVAGPWRRKTRSASRVPGHQLVLDVLHMLTGPLVLSSANHSGQPDALTAAPRVGLFRQRGRPGAGRRRDCRFGQPSSVVRINGNRYESSSGGGPGKDIEAIVEFDDTIRVHGQHLPQPDGRNAVPGPAGKAAGLPAG